MTESSYGSAARSLAISASTASLSARTAAISRRSLDFDAPPGRAGKENTLKLGPDGTLSKADAKRLQILLSGKRPKQRKQNKPKKRQFKAAHGCPACAGRHRAHTCGRGR